MKIVLRDPPLFVVIAAILADIPLTRVRRRTATHVAAWLEIADWPRRFFGTLPPRSDPA